MGQSIYSQYAIDAVRDNDSSGQPAHFTTVNVDCWEKIFEYLSFTDIFIVSRTCVRMCEIAGYYFRENFQDVTVLWIESRNIQIVDRNLKINGFSKWIRKLSFMKPLEEVLRVELFCSLKSLNLYWIALTETQVDYIKDVLSHIESVELLGCTVHRNFFEQFLKYCPKLKLLNLQEIRFESDAAERSFFQWTHSTLQTIIYYPELGRNYKQIELIALLERNPNIKHLEVHGSWLFACTELFAASKIRLNTLTVNVYDRNMTLAFNYMGFLQMLHERNIYQSLCLDEFESRELVNELLTLNGLKILRVMSSTISVPPLIHLRELSLQNTAETDMQALATHLTKLKRLTLYNAIFADLLPFFRHTEKLSTVKLYHINGFLNLLELNKERKNLKTSRKVIIYASEQIYLMAKWATINLNLNLVQVARQESIDIR